MMHRGRDQGYLTNQKESKAARDEVREEVGYSDTPAPLIPKKISFNLHFT